MTAPPNGNYTALPAVSLLDGIQFSTYHAWIERATGFLDQPSRKESYKYSWPDEHGVDMDLDANYYDERKCSLDLIISGTSMANLYSNINTLFAILKQAGYHHLKMYSIDGIFTVFVSGAIAVTRLNRGVTNKQYARLSIPLIDIYPVKYTYYTDQTEAFTEVALAITTTKPVIADWGDGSVSTLISSGIRTHTYTTAGLYCIMVLGGVDGVSDIIPTNATADSTLVTVDSGLITVDQSL